MDSSVHEEEPAPTREHSGGPSSAALPHQGGRDLEVRGETRFPSLWTRTQNRETPRDSKPQFLLGPRGPAGGAHSQVPPATLGVFRYRP